MIVKIPIRRPRQVRLVTAETIFTLFPDGEVVLNEPGEPIERERWDCVEVEIDEAQAGRNQL